MPTLTRVRNALLGRQNAQFLAIPITCRLCSATASAVTGSVFGTPSAVADFMLQDPNIQQSRLRVYGFADTRPASSNETREGRAENRRIEIEIGQ